MKKIISFLILFHPTLLIAQVAKQGPGISAAGGTINGPVTMSDHLTASAGVTASSITVNGEFSVGGSTLVVSNGRVGIGDTAPQAKLVVNGNVVSSGSIQASSLNGFRFQSTRLIVFNGTLYLGDIDGVSTDLLIRGGGGTDDMTLKENKVGVGTRNPSTKLHVSSGVLTVDGSGAGITVPTIATSAGAGGLYVCIDSAGVMYKKSSCP